MDPKKQQRVIEPLRAADNLTSASARVLLPPHWRKQELAFSDLH